MKKSILKKLGKRKRKIAKKLEKRNWPEQQRPMFSGGNIHYEFDGRHQGIAHGGIANMHQIALRTGLVDALNEKLSLLKRHLPYFESDHILNIAYNLLAGGTCLQDIELLRNDEAWLTALDAEMIPDPTTAGDFLRRFSEADIWQLMDIKNDIRRNVWAKQSTAFRREAIINVDGTICPTWGECKEGMDISYNGQWGYHPLLISLHNTREPLYIVNRPANAPSHSDSPEWIDKSLDLVGGVFKKIYLRGDTDYSLTEHFDKWDKQCTFVFGVDAMPNLKKMAQEVAEDQWELLEKTPKYQVKTNNRRKSTNFKRQIVRQREFRNVSTECEHIVQIYYQPGKCEKPYRLIMLRKTLNIVKGNLTLFEEDNVRYFFYITNDWKRSSAEVLGFYRGRSDHENDIEQFKNGLPALVPSSDSLLSNWASMVICSLAWDLKAWYGLLLPYRPLGKSIVRMEFKRFLNTFIKIPTLIIKKGRRIYYRVVGYNDYLKHIFKFSETIKTMAFP